MKDDDPLIKELNKFHQNAVGLAEQRNRIVHDSWLILPGGVPRRFEVTARRKLRWEYVDASTSVVNHCAEAIKKLISDFGELHDRVFAQASSSRGTTR